MDDVLELGELKATLVLIDARKTVQCAGHPGRKTLGSPDSRQTDLGVTVEQLGAARLEKVGERRSQDAHIGHRQVESLRPCRRHDVSSVTGQVKTAELHRLSDESTHSDNTLLRNLAFDELPVLLRLEPCGELAPNSFIGPARDVIMRLALQVQTLHLRRTGAHERKTSVMTRVDELCGRWRRRDQHSQPADLHLALETVDRAGGNRCPADAMKAVAASDEVTVQLLRTAIARERHARLTGIDIVQPYILGFKNNLSCCGLCGVNQIAENFVLSIDRNRAAIGQSLEINPMCLAGKAQVNAVMNLAFTAHPITNAACAQQIDRRLLQNTGPHRGFNSRLRPNLKDDRVHAAEMQKMR